MSETVDSGRPSAWGRWWPAGLLLSGCLFAITYLYAWEHGPEGAHPIFWAAVAVLVVTGAGLVAAGPTRFSGFLASLALGALLFLPKLLHSPGFFNYFDEQSHLRAVEELNDGHGLFLENPLNKAVEFYPGMEAAAGLLVSVTGLSTFVAGNLLVAALHSLLPGALFLFYERVSGSTRIALLAVLVYAANPAFVFFDSYFAYESFALPLAASALVAVVLADRRLPRRAATALLAVAILLGVAVVVSHHVTSWALAGILLVLGLSAGWARRDLGWTRRDGYPARAGGRPAPRRFLAAGLATTAAALAWLVLVAPYTYDYIAPTFSESFDAVQRVAGGDLAHRQLFRRSEVPAYEKYGTWLALVVLTVAFAFAVVALVRRRSLRRDHLTAALAVLGATYFASLPLSILISNSAVTRISEYAFIGVAPLVALALGRLLVGARRLAQALAMVLLFVVFLGGINTRTGLQQGLPGPYQPSDPQSMTRDVLAASSWLRERYGTGNVVVGDRTTFAVFGAYGRQQTLSGQGSGAQPWRVFFPRTVTAPVIRELNRHRVRFLVVDRRITREVPRIGWYYSSNEPGQETRKEPLAAASLEKFERSRGFQTVYDNGNVVIHQYLPRAAAGRDLR